MIPPEDTPDVELARAVSEQDHSAMEAFYLKYHKLIYWTIRRHVRNQETIEDNFQDAWINVLRQLPKFNGGIRLSQFIHNATRWQVIRNYHRGVRYRGVVCESLTPGPDKEEKRKKEQWLRDLDIVQTVVPERLDLERELAALDSRRRLIRILKDGYGLTDEEVAGVMGICAGRIFQIRSGYSHTPSQRRVRAKHRALGQCSECRQDAVEGKSLCGVHLAEYSSRSRKLYYERKDLGVCVKCGGDLGANRKHLTTCKVCQDKRVKGNADRRTRKRKMQLDSLVTTLYIGRKATSREIAPNRTFACEGFVESDYL